MIMTDCSSSNTAPSDDVLQEACREGKVETVIELLGESGPWRARPNARDSKALRLAVLNGHVDVVRLLLTDMRSERALPNVWGRRPCESQPGTAIWRSSVSCSPTRDRNEPCRWLTVVGFL